MTTTPAPFSPPSPSPPASPSTPPSESLLLGIADVLGISEKNQGSSTDTDALRRASDLLALGPAHGGRILLGGASRRGKTSLLLGTAFAFARRGLRVLYVGKKTQCTENMLILPRGCRTDDPAWRLIDMKYVETATELRQVGKEGEKKGKRKKMALSRSGSFRLKGDGRVAIS